MTWFNEIETAMKRGNSPYDAGYILKQLRNQSARMFVSGELHGSILVYDDGTIEVGHMAGRITDADLTWVVEKATEFCKSLGHDTLPINGRPGWKRLLRMKGFIQ